MNTYFRFHLFGKVAQADSSMYSHFYGVWWNKKVSEKPLCMQISLILRQLVKNKIKCCHNVLHNGSSYSKNKPSAWNKKLTESEFSLSLNNRSWAVSLHHISKEAPWTTSLWSPHCVEHRCLWGREGISMEIFKYLQYKAWIELHTSKPRILYIHWIKQVCCLTQQWTTFCWTFYLT